MPYLWHSPSGAEVLLAAWVPFRGVRLRLHRRKAPQLHARFRVSRSGNGARRGRLDLRRDNLVEEARIRQLTLPQDGVVSAVQRLLQVDRDELHRGLEAGRKAGRGRRQAKVGDVADDCKALGEAARGAHPDRPVLLVVGEGTDAQAGIAAVQIHQIGRATSAVVPQRQAVSRPTHVAEQVGVAARAQVQELDPAGRAAVVDVHESRLAQQGNLVDVVPPRPLAMPLGDLQSRLSVVWHRRLEHRPLPRVHEEQLVVPPQRFVQVASHFRARPPAHRVRPIPTLGTVEQPELIGNVRAQHRTQRRRFDVF
eukprot:scaffold7346_cov245-Pinguiococcus_pyrenoidosus.AAC.39